MKDNTLKSISRSYSNETMGSISNHSLDSCLSLSRADIARGKAIGVVSNFTPIHRQRGRAKDSKNSEPEYPVNRKNIPEHKEHESHRDDHRRISRHRQCLQPPLPRYLRRYKTTYKPIKHTQFPTTTRIQGKS